MYFSSFLKNVYKCYEFPNLTKYCVRQFFVESSFCLFKKNLLSFFPSLFFHAIQHLVNLLACLPCAILSSKYKYIKCVYDSSLLLCFNPSIAFLVIVSLLWYNLKNQLKNLDVSEGIWWWGRGGGIHMIWGVRCFVLGSLCFCTQYFVNCSDFWTEAA